MRNEKDESKEKKKKKALFMEYMQIYIKRRSHAYKKYIQEMIGKYKTLKNGKENEICK